MNVLRVGGFIRDQRQSAKLSLRKMAGLAGVSIPYLSQVERGLRKPSAEILQAIAKGLRISAETLYVQAGILDERQGSDVATSIMADISLTESQKRALLQIYQAFREETGRLADAAAPTTPALAALEGAGTTAKRRTTTNARTTSRRRTGGSGGRRRAGGGAASPAGSSPHPAPAHSPAITPNTEEVHRG